MKKSVCILILLAGLAVAQDKPRVFVQGKGSEHPGFRRVRWRESLVNLEIQVHD